MKVHFRDIRVRRYGHERESRKISDSFVFQFDAASQGIFSKIRLENDAGKMV